MYVYVWGYRAIYPRSLYEILRDKKHEVPRHVPHARMKKRVEREEHPRKRYERQLIHKCIRAYIQTVNICVNACVHACTTKNHTHRRRR